MACVEFCCSFCQAATDLTEDQPGVGTENKEARLLLITGSITITSLELVLIVASAPSMEPSGKNITALQTNNHH